MNLILQPLCYCAEVLKKSLSVSLSPLNKCWVDELAIQDGRAMCVWREQVYQDDDLHLIVEREPPGHQG